MPVSRIPAHSSCNRRLRRTLAKVGSAPRLGSPSIRADAPVLQPPEQPKNLCGNISMQAPTVVHHMIANCRAFRPRSPPTRCPQLSFRIRIPYAQTLLNDGQRCMQSDDSDLGSRYGIVQREEFRTPLEQQSKQHPIRAQAGVVGPNGREVPVRDSHVRMLFAPRRPEARDLLELNRRVPDASVD